MTQKLLLYLAIAAVAILFIAPGLVRTWLRKLGAAMGLVGRAGQELLSGEAVAGSPLAHYETQAGQAAEEKLLATHPLSSDAALQAQVSRVGAALALHTRRREIPFRFRVIEAAEPRAYSLPGGAVFLSSGLARFCAIDDQQLAAILAHEVVHIDRRHTVRHLAQSAAARAGFSLVRLGRFNPLGRLVGAVESRLDQTRYSDEEEREADLLAVLLLRESGFDPNAFQHVLRRLADAQWDAAPYFRAHPPIVERLRKLATH